MNRIDKLFNDRQNGILSIYFCAGCPDANGTADVIRALEQDGVDMVEMEYLQRPHGRRPGDYRTPRRAPCATV